MYLAYLIISSLANHSINWVFQLKSAIAFAIIRVDKSDL